MTAVATTCSPSSDAAAERVDYEYVCARVYLSTHRCPIAPAFIRLRLRLSLSLSLCPFPRLQCLLILFTTVSFHVQYFVYISTTNTR